MKCLDLNSLRLVVAIFVCSASLLAGEGAPVGGGAIMLNTKELFCEFPTQGFSYLFEVLRPPIAYGPEGDALVQKSKSESPQDGYREGYQAFFSQRSRSWGFFAYSNAENSIRVSMGGTTRVTPEEISHLRFFSLQNKQNLRFVRAELTDQQERLSGLTGLCTFFP